MFTKPEDIANRALQHCGAKRIVTLQDDSKNASEIAQCYDGLRRAELRRNTWRFAVKRAVLYPINTQVSGIVPGTETKSPTGGVTVGQSLPTMLLVPPAWKSTVQYNFGQVVTYNGLNWVCQALTSLNGIPGASGVTDWDEYFGSMCAQPYDSTVAYYVGDLVYENDGFGHVNVYAALSDGSNTVTATSPDPSAVSVYSATEAYQAYQVVQDAQGYFWMSLTDVNQGNIPGVYGFWSATPTYTNGAYVIGSDQVLYQATSLAGNTNKNPANGANSTFWTNVGYPGSWPVWNSTDTYALNEFVAGKDGKIYQSVKASNKGTDPTTATYNPNTPSTNTWVATRLLNPWTAYFTLGTAGLGWVNLSAVGASLTNLAINYPIGSGPSIQTQTKNAFLLPNGYLKTAPQDPKRGSQSFLGAPTGRFYEDWVLDGNYIISNTSLPIVFRFVADVTQVRMMDDMFCEGLGCRIANEVVETLTQSGSKKGQIDIDYVKFMGEARTVNAIEEDSVEPPEDDFITCRI